MKINVIIEGGESTGDTRLRDAFHEFFRKALKAKLGNNSFNLPHIIAGTSRNEAVNTFIHLSKAPGAITFLVVDSEGPLPVGVSNLDYVNNKGRMHNPLNSEYNIPSNLADKIFLMVELMEAWLMADVDALANYYGKGFHEKHISVPRKLNQPNEADVESIEKPRVYSMLEAATRESTRGAYESNKADHSFDLIGRRDANKPDRERGEAKYMKRESIDPKLVWQAADHCNELLDRLASLCKR